MSILRINEFPEGSGSLSGDDIFLFMDDPNTSGITKQISLNQFIQSIGEVSITGVSADTGDIIFVGSTISTRNTDQSMTITTNGNGDIYIGADRNMIFDMNAFSAKGILLQDSQEDGYDDVETPSTLKVGSIYHNTGRMIIESDGRIQTQQLTSDLTSKPSWLSVYETETGFTQNGSTGNDFGFDPSGLWFTGDAQPGSQSYPVRTNFDISSDTVCEIIFTVNHNDGCSDQGICFFKTNDAPQWNWGNESSRIAVQIDCPSPMIGGLNSSVGGEGNDILIEPGYYTFKVTYTPLSSTIIAETYSGQDINGTLLNTLTLNERLEQGYSYRIGFAADQDENPIKSYFTNLIINLDGNLLQTYGGLWLTNGEDTGLFIPGPTNSMSSGYVSLQNNGSEWAFKIDNIDLHNGGIQNAQIFQFNDNNKQSIITGPTPTLDTNAQRLIIQGQRGSGVGEGGDVYFWAGDANTNGGDIKIYAGDADNQESGYGGYINIDAGNGYNQGGNISISAGNSSVQGGDVTITAGYSPNISGNIYIRTGGGNKQWQFNNNGAIVFPNNTTVAIGTFDNGTGGNNGISLNCYVGYELNWQGGHLKCTQDNGVSSANILCDSPIQFPGSGVTNLQIDSSGIVYSDGTTQDSANITSNNIIDFNNAISGLLPTIANSGGNRVLTSTGSTVGINAESNLTFDGTNLNAPYLVSTNADGDEGGEIQLSKAPSSSISGNVVIDVYQNKLRFFEQNGSSRGYYLDLISGGTSASTKLNSVSDIISGSGIVVNNVSGVFNINSKLVSDPTNIPGATAITNIVQISQIDYDNLASTDPNTIYIINT